MVPLRQPGGPITGKRLVPCSWQNLDSGGPMIVAADMGVAGHRQSIRHGTSVSRATRLDGSARVRIRHGISVRCRIAH
jgi:hypothetical protein